MQKTFRVAGHEFLLDIPEGSPLWSRMSQYAPFVAEPSRAPLFTVEVVGSLPEASMEMVYGGDEEPGQPVVHLYRGDGLWGFRMAPCKGRPFCGRVISDGGFTHARLLVEEAGSALFALNNAVMLMFAFATAPYGTLEMHASVVVNGGKAFLWLAKSGTGKSTHSRLWLEHVPGSSLLNDDNPVVRIMEDGHVEVFGSPWSGKTPCYRNEHHPAGAFSEIKRAPVNSISRKSPLEAYALLCSSSSGYRGDRLMADSLHSTFEKIVASVPCYTLECRPDEEAARVSSAELLAL